MSYIFFSPAQVAKISDVKSIDKYVNLITSQHKTQPKFINWLSLTLTMVDDNIWATNSIPSSFDIDKAVGVQLDVLGTILNRSRTLSYQPSGGVSPVLDDDHYRLALKAKIAQNQWDGTIPQINDVWKSLFPDVNLVIIDNQDMTMSAVIDGQLDITSTELAANGYLIPKPMGVKLTIIGITTISGLPYVGGVVTVTDFITISTP